MMIGDILPKSLSFVLQKLNWRSVNKTTTGLQDGDQKIEKREFRQFFLLFSGKWTMKYGGFFHIQCARNVWNDFGLLSPWNTWCSNACTWYSVRVILQFMCVGSSIHGADELQKERNSCPLARSCFIGSCHVGASKRFSRSISLAVYCLYTFSFWLIRSLVDPTLAALVVCGALQFFSLSLNDPRISCYLLFSIIPWRESSAPMVCQGKCAIRTSLALGHVIFISVTQRSCHR